MKEALKVLFLFQRPSWDDNRLPYIFFGIVGWLLIISMVIALIK